MFFYFNRVPLLFAPPPLPRTRAEWEAGPNRPIAHGHAPVYTAVFGALLSVRFYWCKMATPSKAMEEIDPLAPQREAALFYGLFLRGHSADALRRDIDVPRKLLDKLLLRHRNEIRMRARLNSIYQYRKRVLAIFDELVTRERIKERVH
jgi:hypothetical protein